MAEKQKLSPQISVNSDLQSLERQAVTSLENALSEIRTLSDARLKAKLSVSRTTGVARELRELIKVLSVYGC